MILSKEMKVVCICRGGQVRSVAARNVLADQHHFKKVLACGWEKNDRSTVKMLCDWSDVVLVVGSASLWNLDVPSEKTVKIDIGPDRWGDYRHPELQNILTTIIKGLL